MLGAARSTSKCRLDNRIACISQEQTGHQTVPKRSGRLPVRPDYKGGAALIAAWEGRSMANFMDRRIRKRCEKESLGCAQAVPVSARELGPCAGLVGTTIGALYGIKSGLRSCATAASCRHLSSPSSSVERLAAVCKRSSKPGVISFNRAELSKRLIRVSTAGQRRRVPAPTRGLRGALPARALP